MNKKAESFQKYLEENNITCFTVEEVSEDSLNTVFFRSKIDCNGQQLPLLLVLDDSVYGMVKILIAGRAANAGNRQALLEEINMVNSSYKAFKYYIDNNGALMLDCCILSGADTADGRLIYAMFDVIIGHLQEEYKKMMQLIWQ